MTQPPYLTNDNRMRTNKTRFTFFEEARVEQQEEERAQRGARERPRDPRLQLHAGGSRADPHDPLWDSNQQPNNNNSSSSSSPVPPFSSRGRTKRASAPLPPVNSYFIVRVGPASRPGSPASGGGGVGCRRGHYKLRHTLAVEELSDGTREQATASK